MRYTDKSQASSLIRTVSRQLALIRGLPGSGKSHVVVQSMRILLANKHSRLKPFVLDNCNFRA